MGAQTQRETQTFRNRQVPMILLQQRSLLLKSIGAIVAKAPPAVRRAKVYLQHPSHSGQGCYICVQLSGVCGAILAIESMISYQKGKWKDLGLLPELIVPRTDQKRLDELHQDCIHYGRQIATYLDYKIGLFVPAT